MSDMKRSCPGCGSYSSSVGQAFADGDPCPSCGLSARAADEIDTVRQTRADETLKERLAQVLKDHDKLATEVVELRATLDRVRDAL